MERHTQAKGLNCSQSGGGIIDGQTKKWGLLADFFFLSLE